MEYLEKKRREQVRQTAEDRIAYRELLGKLATEMKLGPKDETRLDGILSRLAIQLDSVERDVAILRDHARLTTAVLPRAEVVAELAAIAKISDDYRDRETKALAALAADAQVINSRLSLANDRLRVADKAVDQLEHLNGTHWQLLGRPDPSVEANKRCFVQTLFEQPANPPYSLVAFEAIMNDPKAWATQFRTDSPTIFVPVAGQSEAELQKLLAKARQLVADEKVGRYVLPGTESERPKFSTNTVFYADFSKRLNPDQRYYVGEYAWIPAPGQSAEEFAKCVGAITRKEQVRTDNVTTTLMEQNNKSSWATLPVA